MNKIIFLSIAIIATTHTIQSFALANPASMYCAKVGGKTQIEKLKSGNEIGICIFAPYKECEEWAMFRKICPIGGVNTKNLSQGERYCIIRGGVIKKQKCLLPDRKSYKILK